MSVSASRRTWEEASSPAAVRLAREYEQAWRDSEHLRHRPDPDEFLESAGGTGDGLGARLAVLRTDLTLRWESGEKVGAQWYLDHHANLSEDTIVALAYEEFCLREEDEESPDPAEFLNRFSQVALPLRRVLEIHQLVGSGSTAKALLSETVSLGGSAGAFPEAGQMIAGFHLVEELGRGAFARVFLARERQLADRPVALKVTRRGSREPQTLARLQHTHIVPVHSHRIDRATGLHLLCMPYFGRTTLAQVLSDCREQNVRSGAVLVEAIDRRDPGDGVPAGPSAGRVALTLRTYDQAIAWWGARLAEALAHAHDRGVLHRDIKPSNVLVTSDGMPMLLDFNLAREPVTGDGAVADAATLGGTVDYMAPEHLRALAEGGPESVDGRSDIYSLGVVLYEALTGQRPFASPRRGSSVIEALLRAADERGREARHPRAIEPAVPPALDAIVRRCLEPEPDDRYPSAAELAADLQAVSKDLPLPHSREPWPSRVTGWFRRRRRRLTMASVILVALGATLLAALGILLDRADRTKLAQKELDKGLAAFDSGEFDTARKQLDATIELINHFDKLDLEKYPSRWQGFPTTIKAVVNKLRDLNFGPNLDEMQSRAIQKRKLADRFAKKRGEADVFFQTAERLRFHLLLNRRELIGAGVELQNALVPFFVQTSADWTKLDHILDLLDPPRLERLRLEVNELLFFWIVTLDEVLSSSEPGRGDESRRLRTEDGIAKLVTRCDSALAFAEPKAPWRALRARLQDAWRARKGLPAQPPDRDGSYFEGEPHDIRGEGSALASFQWALLCLHDGQRRRAIQWMRHAVRLEQDNYWYQYFLAYVEDQEGLMDEALNHYTTAMALKPNSPWVRFSRAKIYRSKGAWTEAIADMNAALDELQGEPEARKVHLELGYLYQELGDFARARHEYERVIQSDNTDSFARAARLNRANIDVESGAVDRARAEYDALLTLDLSDTAVRHSRALLELRLGQAASAEKDLSALLEMGFVLKVPDEILAARALARLLSGRTAEAVSDAREARRVHPCPAHERLWQRALLAARQFDELQLDRPDAIALLPIGGQRLHADLRAAADGLARLAAGRDQTAFRATLTRSVILAALGKQPEAVAASGRAIALSRYSSYAHLVRARVLSFGGDRVAAARHVDFGLILQSDEPGLLELHGALLQAAGDPRGAIVDYNHAIARGAPESVHFRKADALMALRDYRSAVVEWSLALRRDPELPTAFLGRAHSNIELHQWDLALADLEQAASWAHADPRIEVAIAVSYLRCLGERPDRISRFLTLTRCAAAHLWHSLDGRTRLASAVD